MKKLPLIAVYVASRFSILLTLLPQVKENPIFMAAAVITVGVLAYYDGRNNAWPK